MTAIAELLQASADVARIAGDVALGHFKRGVAVEVKSDGSPVTVADRAAELAAREWISARWPADDILGEEFGIALGSGARRWFIDPIDGTKSFVRGVPLWGTMIGVAIGAEIVAGAIYCPAAGEMVAAATGHGCWWNGVRCTVSSIGDLESATLLTTDDRFLERPERRERWRSLGMDVGVSRTWGDCYGYVLVATGRAEAMADDIVNPWDTAPLMPIIREAGGVLTDWSGAHTAFGGDAIATNAALSSIIRGRLGVATA